MVIKIKKKYKKIIRFALSLTQILTFVFCRTIVLRKDGEERKVIQWWLQSKNSHEEKKLHSWSFLFQVIQFHYTEWPCHSNPFSNALLEFRRRVRQVMNMHPETQDGPVIVHCKWDSYICDNCEMFFHLIDSVITLVIFSVTGLDGQGFTLSLIRISSFVKRTASLTSLATSRRSEGCGGASLRPK